LQPADLETNGLLWGLESLFYKLKARNIHITFSHSDIDDNLQHNKKLAESIYRICQEAILNSVTHGKSQNININLLYSDHQVKLYINDDGIGCEHIVKNKGITSMEKRVYELSGEISYGSPSEGGFNIKIIFPYEKTAVGVSK